MAAQPQVAAPAEVRLRAPQQRRQRHGIQPFFGKNDKADIDAAFQYPVDDFVIISLVDKNLDFRIRFLELAKDFRQQPRCVVTRSTFVRI